MQEKTQKNLTVTQALTIFMPALILMFSAWINVQIRLTEHEKSIDAIITSVQRVDTSVNSQYQMLRIDIKEVNEMIHNVQLKLKDKADRE